jgi:hypothetical protein
MVNDIQPAQEVYVRDCTIDSIASFFDTASLEAKCGHGASGGLA